MFAKVWLGVSWKPKFFVEFKIISAKFFVSRNKKMLFCRHRFFLVFWGMGMLKLMPILLTVPPQQISSNIFVFQINPVLEGWMPWIVFLSQILFCFWFSYLISDKVSIWRNLSFYFILFLLVFPLLFFSRIFLQIFSFPTFFFFILL